MEKQWFETWFDTEEYHQLYKNRDDHEASIFIGKLIQFLSPAPNASFLDIACGKGRHAKPINDLGYKVVGYDLSSNSISATSNAFLFLCNTSCYKLWLFGNNCFIYNNRRFIIFYFF